MQVLYQILISFVCTIYFNQSLVRLHCNNAVFQKFNILYCISSSQYTLESSVYRKPEDKDLEIIKRIDSAYKSSEHYEIKSIFKAKKIEMIKYYPFINRIAFNIGLQNLLKTLNIQEVDRFIESLSQSDKPAISADTINIFLVDAIKTRGDIDRAHKIFQRHFLDLNETHPSVRSINIMMDAYRMINETQRVEQYYNLFQSYSNIKPDSVTFSTLIRSANQIEQVIQYIEAILNSEINSNKPQLTTNDSKLLVYPSLWRCAIETAGSLRHAEVAMMIMKLVQLRSKVFTFFTKSNSNQHEYENIDSLIAAFLTHPYDTINYQDHPLHHSISPSYFPLTNRFVIFYSLFDQKLLDVIQSHPRLNAVQTTYLNYRHQWNIDELRQDIPYGVLNELDFHSVYHYITNQSFFITSITYSSWIDPQHQLWLQSDSHLGDLFHQIQTNSSRNTHSVDVSEGIREGNSTYFPLSSMHESIGCKGYTLLFTSIQRELRIALYYKEILNERLQQPNVKDKTLKGLRRMFILLDGTIEYLKGVRELIWKDLQQSLGSSNSRSGDSSGGGGGSSSGSSKWEEGSDISPLLINGRMVDALMRCHINENIQEVKNFWKSQLFPLIKNIFHNNSMELYDKEYIDTIEKGLQGLMYISGRQARPDVGWEVALSVKNKLISKISSSSLDGSKKNVKVFNWSSEFYDELYQAYEQGKVQRIQSYSIIDNEENKYDDLDWNEIYPKNQISSSSSSSNQFFSYEDDQNIGTIVSSTVKNMFTKLKSSVASASMLDYFCHHFENILQLELGLINPFESVGNKDKKDMKWKRSSDYRQNMILNDTRKLPMQNKKIGIQTIRIKLK